jgi:hypothetical protein
MTITNGRSNPLDPPVKHFGESYNGIDASGWHVTLRDDNGELESLGGPFPTWGDAMVLLAKIIRRGSK